MKSASLRQGLSAPRRTRTIPRRAALRTYSSGKYQCEDGMRSSRGCARAPRASVSKLACAERRAKRNSAELRAGIGAPNWVHRSIDARPPLAPNAPHAREREREVADALDLRFAREHRERFLGGCHADDVAQGLRALRHKLGRRGAERRRLNAVLRKELRVAEQRAAAHSATERVSAQQC